MLTPTSLTNSTEELSIQERGKISTKTISEAIDRNTMDLVKKQVDIHNTEEAIQDQYARKLYKDHLLMVK